MGKQGELGNAASLWASGDSNILVQERLTSLLGVGILRAVEPLSFSQSRPAVWTVTELNRYVRDSLETDYRLQDLWISGEIRDLSSPPSGHLYFSLVDDRAVLKCVIWRSEAEQLAQRPQEGEGVEVHGRVGLYEAGGQYQLYGDDLRLAGEGVRTAEFLRLKAKLEAEGLFDPARKRPLPARPNRIGVISSRTGAALQDVLNVFRRRYPLLTVQLAATAVQGKEAPGGIVRALQDLNRLDQVDLILLVRGGGSMEDLAAFNSEQVVRAVADSLIPVVTGIGHETDSILADFVADLRAPTPSAAAELVTPDRAELIDQLQGMSAELKFNYTGKLQDKRRQLEVATYLLTRLSPRWQVANAKQQLDDLLRFLSTSVSQRLAAYQLELEGLANTLEALNPMNVLGRGFALVRRVSDGSIIRSLDQVQPRDRLRIQVQDGEFGVQVEESGDPEPKSEG